MSGRVDFYVRPETSPEALERFACRLVETVWQRGHAVLVLAASDTAARRLDDLLVTSPGLWNGELDVLLNLTPAVPEESARAPRIAEVVPHHGPGRDAARQRFREYRDRGFELRTHR